MKGEFVIVRSYGGEPLLRRIWDINGNIVYITNDEQYQILIKGESAIGPIGFPREDVFQYDKAMAELIGPYGENGKWDWNKLVHF